MGQAMTTLTVVRDGLMLCDDCYTGACDSSEREAEVSSAIQALEATVRGGRLVPDCDANSGYGVLEYSRSPCDCCHSSLGGPRHQHAVLGHVEIEPTSWKFGSSVDLQRRVNRLSIASGLQIAVRPATGGTYWRDTWREGYQLGRRMLRRIARGMPAELADARRIGEYNGQLPSPDQVVAAQRMRATPGHIGASDWADLTA